MSIPQIQHRTLGEQVRDVLHESIVSGLFPPGERLTEIDLAEKLSVSRGSLREAILQLTEEGLLRKTPYKGLHVRAVDRTELMELCSMRVALERFAFEESWNKRDDESLRDLSARLDGLKGARERGDLLASVQGEVHFHSWIYELSGHGILQSQWRHLKPVLQLYLSVHQRRHGAQGAFMSANLEYLRLAQGTNRVALDAHLALHMKEGLAEALRDIPDLD